MADQVARQDPNKFPGLIAHTGTAGTAEIVRVVADSSGNLGVNIVSGEIVASLGTVGLLEAGTISVLETGTVTSKPFAVCVDGTQTTNVTYVGMAVVGASQTASVWQIKKLDESGGTTGDLVVTYADGNSNFDNTWTGRSTITYS